MIRYILLSLQLFTIIRIKKINNKDYKKDIFISTLLAPIVGIIISSIFFIITYSTNQRSTILVIVYLLYYSIITNLLHIDGLSDIFDGIGAYYKGRDPYKAVKDSNTGIYGIVAIVLYYLISYTMLSCIYNHIFLIIFFSLYISRISAVILLKDIKDLNTKEKGLLASFIDISRDSIKVTYVFYLIYLFPIIIAIIIFYYYQAYLLALYLFVGVLILHFNYHLSKKLIYKKLGFINGDYIGFLIETTQIYIFITYVIIAQYNISSS